MFPLTALIDVGMKVLDKFIPDPEAKAKAQADLLKMQQEGRLAELNADMNEQDNISDRWKADLNSDSLLSKNIRPMTIVALFDGYFLGTYDLLFLYFCIGKLEIIKYVLDKDF